MKKVLFPEKCVPNMVAKIILEIVKKFFQCVRHWNIENYKMLVKILKNFSRSDKCCPHDKRKFFLKIISAWTDVVHAVVIKSSYKEVRNVKRCRKKIKT